MNEIGAQVPPQTFEFDRERWLDGRRLSPAVFLDLNFWIGLSDGSTPNWKRLRETLERCVVANELVCPLSLSVFLELWKMSGPSRRARAETIDALSRGVTLRHPKRVFVREFEAALLGNSCRRNVAYSPLLDSILLDMQLEWPDLPEGAMDARGQSEMSNTILDQLAETRLCGLLDALGEAPLFAQIVGRLHADFGKLCSEESAARAAEKAGTRTPDVLRAEFSAMARSIQPEMMSVILNLTERRVLREPANYRDIVDACRTFWSSYRLLAAIRSSGASVDANDLWDHEHLSAAAGYVDIIATDSKMRHLCDTIGLEGRFGTKVVSTPEKLQSWVEDAVQAGSPLTLP